LWFWDQRDVRRNSICRSLRATDGTIRRSVFGPYAALFALISLKAVESLAFSSAIGSPGEVLVSTAGMMKRLKRS
jgi:hypothetical protein